MIWSVARGTTGSESPEALILLEESILGGSLAHRGPRWRWELAEVGARVHAGVSAYRFWIWLECPSGRESEALLLLEEILGGPQLRGGDLRRAWREHAESPPYRGPGAWSERAKQVWLGERGCPVEPIMDWQHSSRFGWRARVRSAHSAILQSGQPSLVILGPRSPEEFSDSLDIFAGRGGTDPPLRCGLEQAPLAREFIVVDYPGSRAHLRSLQPVDEIEPVAQQWVVSALMGTYESRVNRRVRMEQGMAYGAWGQRVEMIGRSFVELEIDVDVEDAVRTLQGIEQVLRESLETGLTEEEILRAQGRSRLAHLDRVMHPSARVSWASWYVHMGESAQAIATRQAPARPGPESITEALQQVASSEERSWILVGDLSVLGPALEEAGLAPVTVWGSETLWIESRGID